MSAITTPRLSESTDSFLRFAMRADAVCSGLMGIAGIPLAGWLAETSGTPIAFEYAVSAFFIVFAVGGLLARRAALRAPGRHGHRDRECGVHRRDHRSCPR